MEQNILVNSVGGQGGVTLARVLSHAALAEGLNVRVGETLGMAQRGGSVQSHVRVGEKVKSGLTPRGRCSVLLSLEASEAVRAPEYLSPSTTVILSTSMIHPTPVMLREAPYPSLQQVTEALKKIGCRCHAIDARRLADEADASSSQNIVILGAYAALGGSLRPEALRSALGEALHRRFLEANLRAFETGYAALRSR